MRTNQTVSSRFGQIGKSAALAGAIAALSLTTPTSAHAGGNGVGAAIGLGLLGGVIAGAAIANSAPPAYGGYAPAPAYYYPPQPYQGYYAPSPTYYRRLQPYYGWTPTTDRNLQIRRQGRQPGLHQEAGHCIYGWMCLTTCC